ncbi:MAG: tetratricopeptide repeat protein [Planctomycetes bacterium]|nr:tetratricopeptide repeat protein [Planctomycetota bacterium]
MTVSRRLHRGRLLAVIGACALLVGGAIAVHRWQQRRAVGDFVARARALRADGKVAEAGRLLQRYLLVRPDDPEALAAFARIVLERASRSGADPQEQAYAWSGMEEAIRRNPDDPELHVELARFLVDIGRYGDAAAHLDTLGDPRGASAAGGDRPSIDREEVQLLRARIAAGTGRTADAVRIAGALVGFNAETGIFAPVDRPGRHAFTATTLLLDLLEERLGDPATARRVVDHVRRTHSDQPAAMVTLADWYRDHGNLAEARRSAALALGGAPDDPAVLRVAGNVALDSGDHPAAERHFRRLVEVDPAAEEGHLGLASTALRRGDPAAAVDLARTGVESCSGSGTLLLILADAQLQADDLEGAARTIESAAALRGAQSVLGTDRTAGVENPAVTMLRVRLAMARREWLAATRFLEAVRPFVGSAPARLREVDLLLARCAEQLGRTDVQVAATRRAIDDDESSLEARLQEAAALAASGQTAGAIAGYELVAAALPAERFEELPRVWNPLLRLLVDAEMARPAAERSWVRVEALERRILTSPRVSPVHKALVRADRLVREGDPQAAVETLAATAAEHPLEPQALAGAALLALGVAGPGRAGEILATAPAELAGDPLVLMARAQVAARQSAAAATAEFAALEAACRDLPDEQAVKVLSNLATLRRDRGEIDAAAVLWQEAARRMRDPLQPSMALLEIGCDRRDGGAVREAVAGVHRVVGADSPEGRVATATRALFEVRERHAFTTPGDAGLSEADAAGLAEARQNLYAAGDQRPGWPRVESLLGEIARFEGDDEVAVGHFERAIDLGATSPALFRQLSALLIGLDRLPDAQRLLDRLAGPGGRGVERVSAEMEVRRGDIDGALAEAERVLESGQPVDAADLLWFGELLRAAGDAGRAETCLERAVAAAPGEPAAWVSLVIHQHETGNAASAERTLSRAEAALGPDALAFVFAQAREAMGRFGDAEATLREAAGRPGASAEAHRHLVSFLMRRQQSAAAIVELEALLAADPPAAMAAWGRRALASLLADRGTHRDTGRAIALLDANEAQAGRARPGDLALAAAILGRRPDPRSWRLALERLDRLREVRGSSRADRLREAGLRFRTGDTSAARNLLVDLAGSADAPLTDLVALVDLLLQTDDLDSARTWMIAIDKRAGDHPSAIALRARLARATGDEKGAAAAARSLLPDGPVTAASAGDALAVARLYEQLGFAAAAEKLLLEVAPVSTAGLVEAARFLGASGRPVAALDLLDEGRGRLAVVPRLNAAVDVVRAAASSDDSVIGRVEGWCRQALRDDPGSVAVASALADLLALADRSDEATALVADLLARDGWSAEDRSRLSLRRAAGLAAPATADEALALLEEAEAELGPIPDLLDARGLVLLARGDAEAALSPLGDAALAASPEHLLHLATALAADGRRTEAKASIAKARKAGLDGRRLSAADRARLALVETAPDPS